MLQLEWLTSPKNDLVADSLSLLILQINEKPTPQLLTLMETVADDRTYDDFVKKLLIILQGHFEEATLVTLPGESDQQLVKYQIAVKQSGLEAIIDTMTREVQVRTVSQGDEDAEMDGAIVGMEQAFKKAIDERIKDLMEVHAPVDLNRHHHHGHCH